MTRAIRFAADHYLVLPFGAAAALLWANSRPESYFVFSHATRFAINDVAMVFFFALVTEEIIEAMVPGGALHTWRRLALPVVAAAARGTVRDPAREAAADGARCALRATGLDGPNESDISSLDETETDSHLWCWSVAARICAGVRRPDAAGGDNSGANQPF